MNRKKLLPAILILVLIMSGRAYAKLNEDELDIEGWTLEASSINANNGILCEVPERAIDSDLKSHWHTMIRPKAELPQSITITLPKEELVSGYRYYPRADGGPGICQKYEIYVSANGKDYMLAASGTWGADTSAKTAYFGANIKVKSVKLLILSATGGYASAGELRLVSAKEGYKDLEATGKQKLYDEEKYDSIKLKEVLFDRMQVECTGNSAYRVENLADGNSLTYWHTEMISGKLPQDITYDLGYSHTVEGLRYIPRQDGNLTGHFQEFSVYTSDDGEEYKLLKKFTSTADNFDAKDFMFDDSVKTRYLKIRLEKGLYGYGTCAEIYFLQTGENVENDRKRLAEAYTLKIGSEAVKILKNEKESETVLDAAPFICMGSTFVPLRGLMEEMGCEVIWNGEDQSITVLNDKKTYRLRIEDDRVYINGVRYNAAAPPMLKGSRAYIPLRFMSEQMGYSVYWSPETQEIKISR